MIKLAVENNGDLAVVEVEGGLVQRETTCKLRDVVTLQGNARIVVLDLSKVKNIATMPRRLTSLVKCSRSGRG